MPIADVDIANAALIDLGHETIQSFLDDSDQARAVNAIYSLNRDRVTASHSWNFATQRVSLAAAVITLNTNEWDHAYLIPADALRVLYVEPRATPFVVENGYILTNASSPILAPVLMRVTDPAKFSQNFISALQYRLAASLCTAITARRGNAQDYWRLYQLELQEARTADGMEAKLRAGGWAQKAPVGYINKERLVSSNKYDRWVEIDPDFSQVLRLAWDLLLTGRYTLIEICEELATKGLRDEDNRRVRSTTMAVVDTWNILVAIVVAPRDALVALLMGGGKQ